MANKETTQNFVRIFLILFFVAWALRLAYKFNAQIDAIGMLIFSMLIYASKNK